MADEIQKLEQQVKKAKGTERLQLLLKLGEKYCPRDVKAAIETGRKVLEVSEREELYNFSAQAYHLIGYGYSKLGKTQLAREILQKADVMAKSQGLKKVTAQVNITLANTMMRQRKFQPALECLLKSQKLLEEIDDDFTIASVLHNIGYVFKQMGMLDRASEYFHKALVINIENKNEFWESINHGNIGMILMEKNDMNAALRHCKKSMELSKKIGTEMGMASALSHIGTIYLKKGKLETAQKYIEKSLQLHKKLNDQTGMAFQLMELGKISCLKGKPEDGLSYFEKTGQIADQINGTSVKLDLLLVMSTTFATLKQFELALNYCKQHDTLKHFLINKKNTRQINEMEAKYERDKKEREKEIERLKNIELKKALEDLRASQNDLIGQSKLANIGKLTADIAGEIEKPISKLQEELAAFNEISVNIKMGEKPMELRELQNLGISITNNGKSAKNVVKSLLKLKRGESNTSEKQQTNELVNQWLKQ